MSKKGRKRYCVSILKVVIKLVGIFIIRQAPRAAKTMGLSRPRGISRFFFFIVGQATSVILYLVTFQMKH